MKYFLFVFFIFLSFIPLHAQCTGFSFQVESPKRVHALSVTVDDQNNVYTIAVFDSILYLANDTFTSGNSTLGVVLIKTGETGGHQWAKMLFTANVINPIRGFSYIDGHLYFTGTGSNLAIGSGLYPSQFNIFILKLDTNGGRVWHKIFTSNNFSRGSDITGDGAGGILVVGRVSGNITLGQYTNSGPINSFLMRMNSDGDITWVVAAEQSGTNFANAVHLNNNEILIGGAYTMELTFGNITIANPNISGEKPFIASFDLNGNILWMKGMTGGGYDLIYDITSDNDENIYVTGRLTDTTFFDTEVIIISSAFGSSFFAKLNPSGDLEYLNTVGSLTPLLPQFATGIHYFNDEIFVVGHASGENVLFDTISVSLNRQDLFIARYSLDGKIREVRTINSQPEGNSQTYQSVIDGHGNVYVGAFHNFKSLQVGDSTFLNPDEIQYGLFWKECFQEGTGIPDGLLPGLLQVRVYPNPTGQNLWVSLSPETVSGQMRIYDISGRVLAGSSFTGSEFGIDMATFPSGVYFLVIDTGNKKGRVKVIRE